ncbi:uncharacterized protein A4U43_C05F10470 [Asparagus officinalis]|uniref:Histidine-containing phosphotransfer protein n=1 Tax=Asparagus officinalis TaxID=4686 RepID=A0A5P1ETA9_ASPOF|nr:uncharacterized protein A4U43_C05F10470 [Asparagus officinalis]
MLEEDGGEFLVEVIKLFCDDSERMISELSSLIDQPVVDFQKVGSFVHQLKGSSSRSIDHLNEKRRKKEENEKKENMKYLVEVEKGAQGSDGHPSVGPTYRSIFAKDGFPPPIPGLESCWDIFRLSVEKYPENRMFGRREIFEGKAGKYAWMTYKQVYDIVMKLDASIRSCGVEKELDVKVSKKADQIKIEALKRADHIKTLVGEIEIPIPISPIKRLALQEPSTEEVTSDELERVRVTNELREFVKGITISTFRDFPMEGDCLQSK